MERKRIAILGSTGSIGKQTLEVLCRRGDLEVCALAAGRNWQLLIRQVKEFRPQFVAISQPINAKPSCFIVCCRSSDLAKGASTMVS